PHDHAERRPRAHGDGDGTRREPGHGSCPAGDLEPLARQHLDRRRHGRPHQHHRRRRPDARRSHANQRGDSRRGRRRGGDHLRGGERPGDARRGACHGDRYGVREGGAGRARGGGARRAGRAAVREAGLAADAGAAARIRAAGGRAAGAARGDAAERSVRDGDPDVHPAADGLMALRSRHLVVAGGLAAVALLWASRDAWPWRRPLTAAPIVVSSSYDESAHTLGPRETLGELLQRSGITGREYAAFLSAATALQPRRLRPGLIFHVRRLVTDSLPDRLMVRTGPAQRLWVERTAAGWLQHVEEIPWTIQRVRVVGSIVTSLYDALDQAVPDSFLPATERRQLAWGIADVYDWEVDFTRDVQRGDRFEILLERLESPEGERRFGRILAARVDVGRSPS